MRKNTRQSNAAADLRLKGSAVTDIRVWRSGEDDNHNLLPSERVRVSKRERGGGERISKRKLFSDENINVSLLLLL